MAERAGGGPRRRTGATIEGALQHRRRRAVRKEAEPLDGGSEQRDHGSPDAGGHVHDTGIARYEDPRPGEQRAGLLERELASPAAQRVSPSAPPPPPLF